MRAGNRPAVKHQKRRRGDTGRSVFINWYHSWWVIVLALLFFPIVGIVLLVTSPHKRWQKVLFITVAVVYTLVTSFGIGNLITGAADLFDTSVDDSISRAEYIERCESITAEQFYRATDGYEDAFVSIRIKIVEKVTYVDDYYHAKDYVCYLCEDADGSTYRIVLRDCLLQDAQRLVVGDIITAYGEGAGECRVYDLEYNEHKLSLLLN